MLKLNVGLSKKVGEPNYGSRGASVHVELELDTALASQPDRMRERIRELFGLARTAVDEELRTAEGPTRDLAGAGDAPHGNGHHAHGHHAHDRNGSGRSATQSQARAIYAIARRQQVDLAGLLRTRFGCDRPEDLSLEDASDLIDELDGAASGNGGRK